jgi:hypothetical protein
MRESDWSSDVCLPIFAGYTATPKSAFVNSTELALHQAVIITELLFLNQTQTVIGVLATRFGTVHARAIVATLEIFRRAEDGNTKATADANAGTSIASHFLKRVVDR